MQPTKHPNSSALGALRTYAAQSGDEDAWRLYEDRVRSAMVEHSGAIKPAAEALGISPRTLFRILNEPRFYNVERRRVGRPDGED